MNYAISTRDLSRRFGKQAAVDGLNLDVPEGSIYAFLGPNGAGKTTTIKMILNLLPATSGSATVLGTTSHAIGPQLLQQIGYVSENQQLPDWMTVSQLIAFCRPLYPNWDDTFCDRLVKQFELPTDRKLKNLSRGMRMKAALLTSLAYRPKLLVMDEPFSGLDPLVRDEVIRGMLELTEQERWTVFISSHDIDEVERLADWVGIINAGSMHLSESTESLLTRFRFVECVLPASQKIPTSHPAAWINLERTASTLRIVETDYRDESATENRVREFAPLATQITISELTLRDVFLALAKSFRLKN